MALENSTDRSMIDFLTEIMVVTSETNSTAAQLEMYPLASRLIYLVGFPVVMVIGLLGNVCSLATTTRKRFRKRSSYWYLSVLAVADSFVLVLLGSARITMMATKGKSLLFPSVYCTVLTFLYYQSTHFASWLLVAITVDRHIHIHYLLLRTRLCTMRRAQQVCAVIAVLSVLVNIHVFGTAILVKNGEIKHCAARPGSEKFIYEVWPYLDFSLYSYLPSLCITIMNVFTCRHLWRTRALPANMYGQIITKTRHTTIMLVNMTSFFVISTVVGTTIMLLKYSLEEVTIRPLVALSDLLIYINHAINFYIYWAFAKEIRVEFKRITKRARRVLPFPTPPLADAIPKLSVIHIKRYGNTGL